jgi:protocatechuate 3,4-dioxygenase beta subunit
MTWGEEQGEPWCVKTDANGDATFPLLPKTSYSDFGVGGDKYAAVNYLGQRGIMQRPAVETLHVTLGGSVNGVVMSDAAGAPAHTYIQAYRKDDNDGNNRDQLTHADANGSFTFKKLAPGTYTISLEFEPADAKSWAAPAAAGVKVVSGKAVSDVNFMLTHGAIIKGVVREKGTNKPINNNPNYRVNLTFYGPAAPQGESNGVNVQLQQDGSYQICVAPGDQTVTINDQEAAPESENRYRTETIHVASGQTKEFNIDLAPTPKKMTVHGKVLSADGAPVNNASVSFINQSRSEMQTTNANGEFTQNNVETGFLVDAVTKDAATSGFVTLTADSDKSDLVLTLSEKPAPMATGKVVDTSGKPLEGAAISGYFSRVGEDRSYNVSSMVTTNKSGEYSIGPVFPGLLYSVNVMLQGYVSGSADRLEAQPHKGIAIEPITLAPKNSHIHGQVINLSEQPIAGATVAENGDYFPATNTTVTDKNGYFTLGNLPQGVCNLSISAPGYEKDEQEQTKTGIDNAEFSLAKEDPSAKKDANPTAPVGNATLTGKVVDDKGKPLTGISIQINCRIKVTNGFAYIYISSVNTDENGQYQFNKLAKGANYLVFYSQDRAVEQQKGAASYFQVGNSQEINSLEDAQVAKDIVLKIRDSFVAGKVVDSQGNPVKSASVNIQQSKCNDWAQTTENGEFRFKVLSAGDVAISSRDRNGVNIAKLVVEPGADNLVLTLAPPKYHGDGTNARKIVKATQAKAISEGKALLIDLYGSSSPEQRAFFDDKEVKPIIDKYFEVAHLDLYDGNVGSGNIDAVFYLSLYKSELIGISRSGKASVIEPAWAEEALTSADPTSKLMLKVLRQTEPKITDAESATLLGALKRAQIQ